MKKKVTIVLAAFALTVFSGCGNEANNNTNDQVGTGSDVSTPTEADTSITLDPDTTTEHDMAL